MSSTPSTSSSRLGRNASIWLLAFVLGTFFAASSAPSPLYGLYRQAWGFSAFTLTMIFSSYALALLAALLVFGALSDHLGRRVVVLGSLVIELLSVAMFWMADSVGWLFAARIVQGLATGIATASISAGLLDFDRDRGSLVNSVAPMFGMALGALGTSLLVQFAPAPTHLVFVLLLLIFGVQTLWALRLPETVEPIAGAWASLRPRIAIPPRARTTLWQILPINTAQWSLGGFFLSLGPTLTHVVTGNASPAVGGASIASLVLSSAFAILMVRQRPARAVLVGGAATLAVGLAITLIGMVQGSTFGFFAGTLVSGLGFGSAFNGAVRSLVPLAEPHERASLMSSFYVLSYLAFSVPSVIAGLCAGRFGLMPTALGFGIVLVMLAVGAVAAMLLRAPAPALAA